MDKENTINLDAQVNETEELSLVQMLADTDQMLREFAEDYRRMAE